MSPGKNIATCKHQVNMEIPALTTEQMIEVDRLMIEEYGIELIQMMENAGQNLAELTGRLLGASLSGAMCAVLCGPGNNGGGGMVAARHLQNWGAQVQLCGWPEKLNQRQRCNDTSCRRWVLRTNQRIYKIAI